MSLMSLKSGTDIRGTAIGENTDLTDEAIKKITAGFIRFTAEKCSLSPKEMTVAVGHDSRLSAERIKKNVISVLCANGVKVLDCSLASTPAMFMTTVTLGCTASVQITASHHPFDKNGLKFFTKDGGFEGSDIAKILQYAETADVADIEETDTSEKIDFMSQYSDILCKMICDGVNAENYEKPLDSFHIVTDAGNGVGGFYAEKVLKKLGADIEEGDDFLTIRGKQVLNGAEVTSHNDHRITMAMAIAACRCEGNVVIDGARNSVTKSYPNFFEDYKKLGGKVK